MRRFITVMAAFAALLMMLAAPAQAYDTDYLNQSRRMLQDAPVFVSSAVSGVSDADTQGATQALEGKNLALVVLPTAATTSPGDTIALAMQLAQDSNYGTVGVLVDGFFAVGSRTLSPDKALKIGDDINGEKSLVTIATKLAQQVATAPEPSTQNAPNDSSSGSPWGVIGIVVLSIAVLAGAGVYLLKRRTSQRKDAAVDPFGDLINAIANQIDTIASLRGDSKLALSAARVLKYTTDLFKRLERSANKGNKQDVETARVSYVRYLGNIKEILDSYIDAKEYSEYYRNPAEVQAEAVSAVAGFEDEVLNHVRMVTSREGLNGFYDAVASVQLYTPPERTLLQ